jgi:hypothetical protein
MKNERRLKPEDREYLATVRRLFLAEPAGPSSVDQAVDCRLFLVQEEPERERPAGRPTYGLNRRRHVVELPRRASDERGDPVCKVCGPGWPAWFPVAPTDQITARDKSITATT